MILQKGFGAQVTFLIVIDVENSCAKQLFFQDSLMNIMFI